MAFRRVKQYLTTRQISTCYTLGEYSTRRDDVMPGYANDKDALKVRLRRIEGQVRGLQKMIDEDAYCIDVVTQVSAATKALQSVALKLMEEHLAHCVAEAVAQGGQTATDKIAEASAAIERLVRS